ncbi:MULTISPECIES: hypothetical protein [unclassified Agarivorans]|uniref:hypothetical protein n=1 Tax=unclassified Agarivorans TaxID=2636026 RepID=UPI0026E323E1|nr:MULTISPECIES: hypothetical protein [unclassified Agarivorans]MDO6686269.1 hypothetical protein [Agarivorans sp. 3_MG-2023]MDO6716282.1 hypothetical protein [Agarivorans sp. 2_MG-2023]
MNKKSVLIVPSNDASLSELIKFSSLAEGRSFEPVFYIPFATNFVKVIEGKGWEIIYNKNKNGKNSQVKSWLKYVAKNFFDNTNLGVFVQTHLLKNTLSKSLVENIKKQSDLIGNIIVEKKISTCLLATDRSVGAEAAVAYFSKNYDLKKIVVSFAYSADYVSSYKLRNSKIYLARYKGCQDNEYVDSSLGRKLFFRPYEQKALSMLGLFPKKPWVLGGGYSDLMIVDSLREKNRLVDLGGQTDKYVVTGTSSHDHLYEAYNQKEKLKKSVNSDYFNEERQLLIISLPQYYEHGLCSKVKHFAIIDSMLSEVTSLGYNILVSLHPKMDPKNYKYLETKFDLSIATQELSKIIAAADMFLATYSSTITWALMCRVPVVIFDYIALDYDDFYSEFSIPIGKTNEDVIEHLKNSNCILKPEFDRKIAMLSPFDGNCFERVLGTISE